MKIMYYELIKMLIEYERNKQPEVSATMVLFKQSICVSEAITWYLSEQICICPTMDLNVSSLPNTSAQCQVWEASKSVGKIEGYQVHYDKGLPNLCESVSENNLTSYCRS